MGLKLLAFFLKIFPAIHLFLIGLLFLKVCMTASLLNFSILIIVIYILPICLWRLHNKLKPLQLGVNNLSETEYSSWWASHQFQFLFNAFPFFETVLRSIPGIYSAWLRWWGSQIGKKVYWTAQVEITDRMLIQIGNGAIFGHKVSLFGHVIQQEKSSLILFTKKIIVGNHVFIGAGSRIGPGAIIPDYAVLNRLTDVTLNTHVEDARV